MGKLLIFIILVILLFILIFMKKENLKNINRYKNYRLGDVVKGYMWKNDKKLYNNYHNLYNNTLASKYIKNIKDLPDEKKWNNIEILDKIIKNESKKNVSLHLRIGDVIGNYKKKNNTFERLQKSIYFYQPSVYEKIIKELKNKGVKEIHIFYSSHTIWDSNSSKYIKIIKDIIYKNNIRIIDKKTGNPDKDFIKMANAKIFIKSGGGFSRLISKLVKKRNSRVISPEDYL
jgi:hypothetical protein